MTSKNSNTPKVVKDPEPIDEETTQARINLLEARITQLETALKNTITLETLVAKLIGSSDTGSKKVRKTRTKRELTPEEKAAFHARMVAGRLAKQKGSKK